MGQVEERAKRQIEYSVAKYMVKHFGRRNKGVDYFLNRKDSEIGDVGVLVQNSQKVELVARKANVMLAFISRGLECKSNDVMLRLYQALAHLEYYERFYLRKDMPTLERVQKFTRMIGLMYEDWSLWACTPWSLDG